MAVYLITGASSGIGAEMCRETIARGNKVYGLARRKNLLDQMHEKWGEMFTPLVCDVTDQEAVKNICAALPELPDVVILNAGIGTPDSKTEVDVSHNRRIMEVNYFGALYFIDALFLRFVERKSGAFVGISSIAAYRALPVGSAYCAGKAALSSALESMRITYWHTGVRFITVHPGFVDTPIIQGKDFSKPFMWSPDRAAKTILDGVEKGKLNIVFPLIMRMSAAIYRMLPARLYRRLMSVMY